MKKSIIWIFAAGLLVFPACEEDNTEEIIANEQRKFDNYLLEENITEEPTESGLYYLEQVPGNGESPETGDLVDILYVISLVDGTVVDTNIKSVAVNNNIYNQSIAYGASRILLENIFPGMSEGIQLMREGGEARLLVPPALGFGAFSSALVPSYSSLIVDVTLINVIKDPEAYQDEAIATLIADSSYTATETPSGLFYVQVEEGTGASVMAGQTVEVDLYGYLMNGRVFMDTDDANPYSFIFNSGGVIEGLNEGVGLMKEGGKAILIIPYQLAYGEAGRGSIPSFMPLVFEVELKSIQ